MQLTQQSRLRRVASLCRKRGKPRKQKIVQPTVLRIAAGRTEADWCPLAVAATDVHRIPRDDVEHAAGHRAHLQGVGVEVGIAELLALDSERVGFGGALGGPAAHLEPGRLQAPIQLWVFRRSGVEEKGQNKLGLRGVERAVLAMI